MESARVVIEGIAVALEVLGVAAIVAAAVYATARAAWRSVKAVEAGEVYDGYRRQLGRGILLGLEFLVAGDIISTVAIEPTLESVVVLAIIVLVRTFLSFTLQVEMTGRWPWQEGGPAR